MDTWDKTYQSDRISIDGYECDLSVSTAKKINGDMYASLNTSVNTNHGTATSHIIMNPQQMRELAALLERHASRYEALAVENNLTILEAA